MAMLFSAVETTDQNDTNIIAPENCRPLRLMGHSFRVLTVDDSYSAGRSDLRLLSGDAFSVFNQYNIQIINIVYSTKTTSYTLQDVRFNPQLV